MTRAPEGYLPVTILGQLDEDQPVRAQVDGIDVVLVRSCGAVHALHDACSHADVALSEGDVDHCHIECWLHGSRFDLRTGIPDSLPATRAVPVYAVHVDGDADDAVVSVNVHLAPGAATVPVEASVSVHQEG